jgi:hypothetical protein
VHGNGTLSYVWSGGVSDGVPFTSGASQTYTVTGTDGNGCTNTSSISIQVNALPVVSAMASDTVICAQDTVSVHGNGALSYVWSGGVSDGVPFTSNASQTYTVTGTDGNGCTNTSSMFILAHPLPQPIITQISTNLICTNVANCSYSWTLNGVQLDTTVFITVSQNGTYYVHVTDINGCSNSDSIVLTAVNTHELLDMTVPFELYPNPTQGVFNLQYFVPSSGRVSFSIFDMSGRCVNKLTQLDYHEKGKYDMQVDLNQMGIADGLYVLLMQTDNLRWIKRFQLVR